MNKGDAKMLERYKDVSKNNVLQSVLKMKNIDESKFIQTMEYFHELRGLQIELVKLQKHIQESEGRLAIILEGRDAAGKGGAIQRFIEHMSPRSYRVVALPKPSDIEQAQWYFRRYVKELPNPGEIVFFDRSWYNRAIVEPVNGFCSKAEYKRFMRQVPEFEHMLYEEGLHYFKLWFSISKKEQAKRFEKRSENPLKNWKLSPVDTKAQELWEDYTHYEEEMFIHTHTAYAPWNIVKANNKKQARLESIRFVLANTEYEGKDQASVDLRPDPNIVSPYFTNFNRWADD